MCSGEDRRLSLYFHKLKIPPGVWFGWGWCRGLGPAGGGSEKTAVDCTLQQYEMSKIASYTIGSPCNKTNLYQSCRSRQGVQDEEFWGSSHASGF